MNSRPDRTNAAEKKFKFDLIEYDDGQVRPNNIILHDKKGNEEDMAALIL